VALGLVLTMLSSALSLCVFFALVVAYANLKQLSTRILDARAAMTARRSRRRFDSL